jgi:hypothetical protein
MVDQSDLLFPDAASRFKADWVGHLSYNSRNGLPCRAIALVGMILAA